MTFLESIYHREWPYLNLFLFFAGYIIPPLLIFIGWVDYEYRYHIMAPTIIWVIFYSVSMKFTSKDLGLVWNHFPKALLLQVGISGSMTALAIIMINQGYVRSLNAPESYWFYIMYLFISGPVQEYVYRAVPVAELDRLEWMPNVLKVMIVTLNFAWLHVIYFDWIIYFASLWMGLVWTSLYYYKRNFWAVSIAHAICGFAAIWFGLI